MSLDEKINEIMTRVGVAKRDFGAARKNLERLGSDQVDAKLERLRSDSAKLETWRTKRRRISLSPTVVTEKPPALLLADNEAAIATLESSLANIARVSRNLETLSEVIQKLNFRRSGATRLFRAWAGFQEDLIQKLGFHTERVGKLDGVAINYLLTMVDSTELAAGFATRQIEQILKHPIMEKTWLGATDTIDAFARIANAIARRPPDIFVAVNEGSMICAAMRTHLKLDVPIVTLRGSAETDLLWYDLPQVILSPRRVWVIGHVARTGATLLDAMDKTRNKFGTNQVFGAVLAASTDAAENLSQFSFHQLAEASIIEMKVDPKDFIHGSVIEYARRDMERAFDDD